MDTHKYRSLAAHERALVAVAVLLDGREASVYLENDVQYGTALKRASADLAAMEPELRMPYVGTLLRAALQDLEREG